jgi:hypothetical protein
MKSIIAGIIVSGASSISQCPEPMTTGSDIGYGKLGLLDGKVAAGFLTVSVSTGIARLVLPI